MNVGLLFSQMPQDMGGGYSFIQGLLEEIRSTQSKHEFVAFCRDPARHDPQASVPTIDLVSHHSGPAASPSIFKRVVSKLMAQDSPGSNQELLSSAIHDFKIDLIWNVGLADYGLVQAPFMLSVWDLQHRLQPFFPEVSLTGWNWQSREDYFREHLRRAAIILTGTETGRSEITHFYGVNPNNVFVVPLPVPPVAKPETSDKPIRDKYQLRSEYLVYPAQFWPHKNHVNLLHALKLLRDSQAAPLDVVFTGSDKGNEAFVIDTVKRLGLEDQVHSLGFVPRSDLIALYEEAFALIFPTFFGPDNLPPLEAFALDCPVLASDVPGAREQLADAAILFDPADPRDIAGSVSRLWGDSSLRSDLTKRGKALIKGRSQRDYVDKVCEILDAFEAIRRCWGHGYTHRKSGA